MGIKRVNTTAYHPQTDGLVERFNRTLTDMLAKTVERDGKNWDTKLPYVLFAYRSSPQESTGESPFYLLYGRDPQLPTETEMISPSTMRVVVNTDNYKEEVIQKMQEAWNLAKKNVKKAQKKQKTYYDRHTRNPTFRLGERVFLYTPSEKTGPAYKFALPYKGPYRVTDITDNTACLQLISQPNSESIHVSINQLRHCPEECLREEELANQSQENNFLIESGVSLANTGDENIPEIRSGAEPETSLQTPPSSHTEETSTPHTINQDPTTTNPVTPWTTRLRQRCKKKAMTRTSLDKDGEM